MIKRILLKLFVVFAFTSMYGQTANSVGSGNWMNPATWDCSCVPLPGYTVTIGHAVVLDTSFGYSSGSVTINSAGSLVKDGGGRDISVTGNGGLQNSGTLDIRYLYYDGGSVFQNTDTFYVKSFYNAYSFDNTGAILNVDSFYNDGFISNNGEISTKTFLNNDTLLNYAVIANIDSLTNSGYLKNYSAASITADSSLNIILLENEGLLDFNQFTNGGQLTNKGKIKTFDFTNAYLFTNNDSVITQNSFLNLKDFDNTSGGYVDIANNFNNHDPISDEAVFNNDGYVITRDSWFNLDTVKGNSGQFSVQDTSYNGGVMKGSFDFCDLTPPPGTQKIDLNTGSISSGITWCNPAGIAESEEISFKAYPNPAVAVIKLEYPPQLQTELTLISITGAVMGSYHNVNEIDVFSYPAGLYFLRAQFSNGTQFSEKIQLK